MKVELILKKITHNWFPKCLCIVSAVALYMFAKTSRLETKTYSIPLVIKEDGNLCRSTLLPSHVNVIIRSEPDNISGIQNGDIQAVLDLSYYTKQGNYNVPVSASLASNVNLSAPVELTVYPEKISIDLEERVRKGVNVEVPVYGNPKHGYEVEQIKVSPQQVVISGPKSMLENINQVSTVELSLEDKKENFTDVKKIRAINRHISLVSSENVNVSVSFKASLINKTFDNVQVGMTHLSPHLEVASVPEVNFTVSGSQLIVEKFFPSEQNVQVDCSLITGAGEFTLPITVNIPDGLKLESTSVENVKITVKENPVPVNHASEVNVNGSEQ